MRTVRNKKELEAAIKAGETEVAVEGKMFKLACKYAAKLQRMKHYKYEPYGAIAETTSIFLGIISLITVLAIIAMCKKYNVEIIFFEGKIKIYYNENHNQQYFSSIINRML